MKFFSLLLAVVGVMSSVEANETFESSVLVSEKHCKAVQARFHRSWKAVDENDDKKVTWKEMNAALTRSFAKHNKHGHGKAAFAKRRALIKKHFMRVAGAKGYMGYGATLKKVMKAHKC